MEHHDDEYEDHGQFEEGVDEEEGVDQEDDAIDVDTPDEFDEQNDDGTNASDAGSDIMEVYQNDGNGREMSADGTEKDDEDDKDNEDEEDAMTWDSMSSASEVEVQPDADDWYPLLKRNAPLPNFALPTTTRLALNGENQTEVFSARTTSPVAATNNAEFNDVNEGEYSGYEDIMRPDPSFLDMQYVVLDHFLHHGHSDVVDTFCKEMHIRRPEEEISEMNTRNEVRNLICAGEMEKAIEKINNLCPEILDDEDINFVVRKQHIIEMVRSGLTTEPVEYFRAHLMKNGKRPCDEKMEIIEKVFTLMVFNAEDETEFTVYYDQSEREQTAKEVNSAILGSMGKLKSSRLDLLAKAISWAKNEVANSEINAPKTTTTLWAERYFSKPFGFDELIQQATDMEKIDKTANLS